MNEEIAALWDNFNTSLKKFILSKIGKEDDATVCYCCGYFGFWSKIAGPAWAEDAKRIACAVLQIKTCILYK